MSSPSDRPRRTDAATCSNSGAWDAGSIRINIILTVIEQTRYREVVAEPRADRAIRDTNSASAGRGQRVEAAWWSGGGSRNTVPGGRNTVPGGRNTVPGGRNTGFGTRNTPTGVQDMRNGPSESVAPRGRAPGCRSAGLP
ncbi:hypothetical protein GCM10009676_46620 [Prauserella halophila]|uniref:Uncharacterized protein n=1 Tax=Prauserella halophila TaxID=185641 RepID=A0ABN1WLB3_9PSEU